MRTDQKLLNFKEYLHLAFMAILFIVSALFFDLDSDAGRAQSTLFVGIIGLSYVLQLHKLSNEYWNWQDDTKDTDYDIIGSIGVVLIVLWIALIDYRTPEVISKFTGFFMLSTLPIAPYLHIKMNKRFFNRYVSEKALKYHKVILWSFFMIYFMLSTLYFIIWGTWERDVPHVKILFLHAFPELFYDR